MAQTAWPILSDREFELFQKLIKERYGVHIQGTKHRFLQTKLTRRLIECGMPSFVAYYRLLLTGDPQGNEFRELMDLVTTNQTDFFREHDHFKFLSDVILPSIRQQRLKNNNFFLRIWSAACATGEEAYSIAITLKNHMKHFTPEKGRVLGTDLSGAAVATAIQGIYDERAVAALAPTDVPRFFEKTERNGQVHYEVVQKLKDLIEFRRLNLMSESFPFRHKFHVIFCRNVMIYFDKPAQAKLIEKLYDSLEDGGYLFTGHAENLGNVDTTLRRVGASIFLKD